MNDDCCYKLYMHLNKTNGKVYIGQTKRSYLLRWKNGKGYDGCSQFVNAIKKYGWSGFEHIQLIEGLSKIEVDYFERFFIAFFDSQNPEFGYNSTAGGDENPMDDFVIREKHRKIIQSPDWQKKVREASRKRCKPVRCVETNIIYDSLKEAAIAVHLKCYNHIIHCCKGERKTAGGYHWEYA